MPSATLPTPTVSPAMDALELRLARLEDGLESMAARAAELDATGGLPIALRHALLELSKDVATVSRELPSLASAT